MFLNTVYKGAVLGYLFFTIVNCLQDLPPYIEKCHLNDPNLNQCLVKATKMIQPYLAKGIPELGIQSIEPLTITEVTLHQGTSALNINAELKDIKVHGLSGYEFSQFDFDVPNLQWFVKATVGPMRLEGKYTANGRILVAPIESSGTFTASVANSSITGYQKCNLKEKKGEKYLNPIITNTTIQVSDPKVTLTSSGSDQEALNNVVNKVISDNVDVLFEELRPVLEKVITEIFENALLRSIEGRVPFRLLYPVD